METRGSWGGIERRNGIGGFLGTSGVSFDRILNCINMIRGLRQADLTST